LQLTSPVEETVATLVALDVHAATRVRFCGGPYEYVPVAVSCSVPPLAISGGHAGVTAMDLSTGAWQVTIVEPDPPPLAAVMVAVPVATPVLPESQLAELVTFCGEP